MEMFYRVLDDTLLERDISLERKVESCNTNIQVVLRVSLGHQDTCIQIAWWHACEFPEALINIDTT